MSVSDAPDRGLEVYPRVSIAVEELDEQQQEELAEKCAVATHRKVESVGHSWWKLWIRNRIFICNKYGAPLLVVVQRFRKVAELQQLATDGGVDVSGGGNLGLTLDWALSTGLVQKKVVDDGDTSAVDLGGGADGGYVSVFVNGFHYQKILCLDNYVRPRHKLKITPGPLME